MVQRYLWLPQPELPLGLLVELSTRYCIALSKVATAGTEDSYCAQWISGIQGSLPRTP